MQHVGAAGTDGGRDICCKDSKGDEVVIQCKRVARFSIASAREEIKKVQSLARALRPKKLIFATPSSVSAKIRDTLSSETQIPITYWDLTFLDYNTKRFPKILEEFFHIGTRHKLPGPTCAYYRSYSSQIIFNENESAYDFQIERELVNPTAKPLTQDLHYLWCNKFPGEPEKSEALYARYPLRWNDLNFRAWDEDGPFDTQLLNCLCSRIDHYILFRTGRVQRPVNPGCSRIYSYGYRIPAKLFGSYYDRFIHFPIDRVRFALHLPKKFSPRCWGYTQPQTEERGPIVPAIIQGKSEKSGYVRFDWTSTSVLQGHSYGIEWAGTHPEW